MKLNPTIKRTLRHLGIAGFVIAIFSSTWLIALADGKEAQLIFNQGSLPPFDRREGATNGRIAFESNRDGGGPEIYTMDPSGANVLQLTNNAGSSDHPAYDPDGSRIVFHSFRDGGSSEIYIMNADGSGQTRLTNDAQGDLDASISATGVIVFEKSCDIYKINANGTNQVRLTETAACDSKPAISPDGTRVAWATLAGGSLQIFRMNSDGTGIVQLTNPPGFNSVPSFSADGTKIAFISGRDGNNEIYVMNADGSNQTRLTSNSTVEQDPAFSPDGNQIAFWTTRDGNSEVYTMNANGMNQTRITSNTFNDVEPSWGPVEGATPTPTATPTSTPTATPTNTPTATPTATPTPGAGFEGDVSPRANPDGNVLSTDVTQLRRFVTGLDTLNPAVNERQRADCAPRSTFGDGALASSDVVQSRRYAAGLDPLTPADGPIARPPLAGGVAELVGELYGYFFGREMRVGKAIWNSRTTVTIPVEVTPHGDEVAASFTLEYDPSVLSAPRVELGDGAMQDAVLTVNASKAGLIGILIDSEKSMVASAMPVPIVMVTFEVISEYDVSTPVMLTDELVGKSLADAWGNTLATRFDDQTTLVLVREKDQTSPR
ncbi:MAG: PD40 domain-containing protein [Pyrinomonadaceae bacterium]|nr:PD40 domain-containing protein [Pyrinomonadaceae bacterium]